ncbi:TPR repeat-containing protein YrrB [Symmachiella dynata]|uniref:tetratricopeptide repeat protein n=1 Tax=Symmachiella dynata TaxID=2527995 RepID=UPI00118C3A10|nr:tetratricopeptide repeat protein [Symmachiella dynata]QDT51886.1 TPR repeat-containing protein YrrB [Symmachiella dynata]
MDGQPVTIQAAVALHQAGAWDRAAQAYEQILTADPQNVDALHLTGVIAHQRGEYEDAIQWIQRALQLRPRNATFHNNLGNALQAVGRYDAAEQHFQTALEISPQSVDARFNLGALRQEQGQWNAALAEFAAVVRQQPGMAKAYHRLGMIFKRQGQLAEAERCLSEALVHDPNFDEAALLLAKTHRAAGRTDEALQQFQRLCAKSPQQIDAHFELAATLLDCGRFDEAIVQLSNVIQRAPDHARAHHHLGVAHLRRLHLIEAEVCFREAVRLRPDFAMAHNSLGSLLHERGELSAAADCFSESIRLLPQAAEPRANLAGILQLQGRPTEAIAAYRSALQIDDSSARIHSNLLMTLHYDPEQSAEEIFEEHQRWSRRHVVPTAAAPRLKNNPLQSRPLRIGYLSADFRAHSVASFIEPLLKSHDRRSVHVSCYSDVTAPDDVTVRLKAHADTWRDVQGKTDQEVLKMIVDDEIDILVDLAGHTGGNRLLVLAQRAAPVQITHLGYGGTTGIPAIDYRLTDVVADPPGESRRHVEELAYLRNGIFCYAPPLNAPPVAPAPCLENGYVTFGSFNNLAKINSSVVKLWAAILHDIPTSRLFMKSHSFLDAATREDFLRMFSQHGINPARLDLLGQVATLREHLDLYGRIDIALDSFPYTGATTTCESLWMGVPVVTLRGHQYVGRLSASLLTQIGCPELIAETPQAYQEIACTLAEDLPRLGNVRPQLREQMAQSPVCDAANAAREMETLYRDMWQRWCRGNRKAG